MGDERGGQATRRLRNELSAEWTSQDRAFQEWTCVDSILLNSHFYIGWRNGPKNGDRVEEAQTQCWLRTGSLMEKQGKRKKLKAKKHEFQNVAGTGKQNVSTHLLLDFLLCFFASLISSHSAISHHSVCVLLLCLHFLHCFPNQYAKLPTCSLHVFFVSFACIETNFLVGTESLS